MFHLTERKNVHTILARGLVPGKIVSPGRDNTGTVACGTYYPPWGRRDQTLGASFKGVAINTVDPHEVVVVNISKDIFDHSQCVVTSNGVLGFSYAHRSFISTTWSLRPNESSDWEAAQWSS